MAGFSLLLFPDCLLLKIFSNLPLDATFTSLALTCERFRNILQDNSLWKRSMVTFKGKIPKYNLGQLMLNASEVLRQVDLVGNSTMDDSDFRTLFQYFKGITHLDVSRCRTLSTASFSCLVNHPGKLQSLRMVGCYWICPDVILEVVTNHSSSLQTLDVTGCTSLTRDVIRILRMAEACAGLNALSLGWTKVSPRNCSNPSMSPIIDTDIRKFATHCTKLRHLRLYRCHIGDDSITSVAENCPMLQSLDISFTYISDESLALIGKRLPKLTSLQLTACWKLSDKGFYAFAEYRPKLNSLNVRRCVDVSSACMAHVISMLPELRELNLSKCFLINDMVLKNALTFCPKLAVIDISGTAISEGTIKEFKATRKSFPVLIRAEKRLKM